MYNAHCDENRNGADSLNKCSLFRTECPVQSTMVASESSLFGDMAYILRGSWCGRMSLFEIVDVGSLFTDSHVDITGLWPSLNTQPVSALGVSTQWHLRVGTFQYTWRLYTHIGTYLHGMFALVLQFDVSKRWTEDRKWRDKQNILVLIIGMYDAWVRNGRYLW